MLDFVKKALSGGAVPGEESAGPRDAGDIRVAACALFLEMAHADGEFDVDERSHILRILQKEYDLPEAQALALTEEAEKRRESSIDMFQFTNLIGQNYGEADRIRVVEILWKVVFADGRVDPHEDYLIHKLGRLLHLTHRQLIDAKLRAVQGGEA